MLRAGEIGHFENVHLTGCMRLDVCEALRYYYDKSTMPVREAVSKACISLVLCAWMCVTDRRHTNLPKILGWLDFQTSFVECGHQYDLVNSRPPSDSMPEKAALLSKSVQCCMKRATVVYGARCSLQRNRV
jgi:hypothetical protein